MKTTTIFAAIAIISAIGIAGTTIGTGILSQQAHAAGCQSFFENGLRTKINCSSPTSQGNTFNDNSHITTK